MIIDDFSNPKRKLTVSEASAANDYFTRRKSEEDRIAGVKAPAKNKKNPANTDYAKKRKQQDVTEAGHDHRRRAAASHDDEECSSCDGTGEGRHEGQSCGACGGSGVARGQYDHDDFDIPDKDDMYEGVAEGVAKTLPMSDAVKVLRQYGADHFKTTSNELHFYKNGRPFSVDLIWNDDATRSVSLSQLNSATRRLKGQGVAEGQVPPEVTHRHDINRTADIEVLGVDHNAKTFNITYNKKPYTVKASFFSQEDFNHWQIPDYEVEIINSNGKNLIDMIDWQNAGDAKTDRQIQMIDTIIAYLDTQRSSDIQYMSWLSLADSVDAEELYNEITDFYEEDQQKIDQAAQWLSKNIPDANARREFAAFVQNPRATQNTSNPQTASKYLMYVAFSYSREGNTEMTPGMKLPRIQLNDPDDEGEFAEKLDALFNKVNLKFDAFENKIIELGKTLGFNTPDVGSGFEAREMYWDQPILTSQPANTASNTAKNILKFKAAIDKYVQSFSSSLTKIGLPGITEYSTWEGVLSDKLTTQQQDYFATPEGFANIANGRIDVSKMINDNMQRQGVAEGSLNEGQYEMMMRNGQVKKFIAKDDTDAKRIAAGHGAKSVIRMKGNVPGDKIGEQGAAEGSEENIDQFISGNSPNFNGESNRVSADTAQYNFINFLLKKGFDVDYIDDQAYPVLVAICQGKMCAWYDFKNAYGYVPKQGKVVFSGTGANGGKYEIIHHGDDFMIRANGKHIDSYGSLKRAMGVLKNEVPGLKQGVAEGLDDTASATPAKNERGRFTAWDDDEPIRLKCEDGEFRTIQEINMLRQKIGMKLFSIKSQQGVAESNTLMKKLHQALLKEGRVKELADDLKTLNDAEFVKKYGKAKAAIRKDMKKVDEGNANSGRRNPIARPDNVPVKLGRIEKLKTGIKHHADSSRYGGTVPDTDDDHLLSPASRHHLHKAVTPDYDIDEARTSAAQRLSTAWDRQRAKSNASLARTPSSIPKKQEPKKADPVPKTVSEHRAKRQDLMAQMLNGH